MNDAEFGEDTPAYDRARQKLKEYIDAPIDDLSVEELLTRRQLLIEIERAAVINRKNAGRQVEWLAWGKKDKRRTKFRYWGNEMSGQIATDF